ncbi:uncharacterized protein LOC103832518 [Brassica rapa]|uniref:uncharacterized protein LOC103832518 n=1 Tax=Brassica campestris TaxID=3711 RepID=UPI0004F1D0D7|nr:uncharacterized protein LOC103832518 [Brassica rapa]
MEKKFQIRIPKFSGGPTAEELLDWIVTVEEILEFKHVPLNQCVPVVAMQFRNRAAAWWTQLKTTRTRLNKPKIVTWDKLKKHLKKTFLPYNYEHLMFQKLQHLRQGNRTVEEYATEFFLLLNRIDLHDSEHQIVARFIGGLRQQIQHTLNLFNPLTIAEAHQQALTVEAQNKTTSSPWSANRQQRSSPTTNAATAATLPVNPLTDTAIVPVEQNRPNRTTTLRCFACGELGHRQSACPTRNRRGLLLDSTGRDVEIEFEEVLDDEPEELDADTGVSLMLRRSCLAPRLQPDFPQRNNLFHSRCTIAGKVCSLIIDSGSSENVIAADAVAKLSLQEEKHPTPYKLAWLQQKKDVLITRRALVAFSIGNAYHDQLYCDVVPMDACHLLLGFPWEFDRRVLHDGFLNTYSFKYNNRNFTLKPFLPHQTSTPPPTPTPSPTPAPLLILHKKSFETAMRTEDVVFILTVTPSSSPITPKVSPEFSILLQEFADVFPEDLPPGLPPLRDIQHQIDLVPDANLPNRPHYRMSPTEHEELRKQVEELVVKGFLRESMSPCAIPALLIPKKDGSWRMCVDSRAVNKITVRYRFPMPRLDDLLDQIGTAFIRFAFNKEMSGKQLSKHGKALRPFIGKFVVVYFDDILSFSLTLEEHLLHLREVLLVLCRDKLFATIKKCEFGSSQVHFLGYIVSTSGLSVVPAKVSAIQSWPEPSTISEARSFHGLASFYRRFVPQFSAIMAPLTNCIRDGTLTWTSEAASAFHAIKDKLTSAPIFSLPDFTSVFELHCDASKTGIGAVLIQHKRPIAFFSEKISGARFRYSTYYIEFYAIIQAVKHWRHYLFHKEFILYTDHDALNLSPCFLDILSTAVYFCH